MAKKAEPDWGEFEDNADSSATSLIMANVGPGGSGKTRLSLTMPEPIAYFLFDPGGLKGVRDNDDFKDKDIKVLDLGKMLDFGRIKDRSERVKRASDAIEKFDEHWDIAIANARSIVVDKEDALWEALRYAHDEVDSPNPMNFGELNLQYRGLFTQAEAHGINFALIRGLQAEWGKVGVSRNGKAQQGFTGKMHARGQKEVEELVQISLWHRWDPKANDGEGGFVVKIGEKCRLGDAPNLIGKEFENFDFPSLVLTLFPNASLEDWGL